MYKFIKYCLLISSFLAFHSIANATSGAVVRGETNEDQIFDSAIPEISQDSPLDSDNKKQSPNKIKNNKKKYYKYKNKNRKKTKTKRTKRNTRAKPQKKSRAQPKKGRIA